MKQLGTHHGGAWKVAYADFVTAMMALFMVLWLTSQNETLKKDLAKFFRDPTMGNSERSSFAVLKGGGDLIENEFSNSSREDVPGMETLYALAQEFMKLVNTENSSEIDQSYSIDLSENSIAVTLYDREAYPLFVDGTTDFTEWGLYIVQTTAWLVERHDFAIRIEGFTSDDFKAKSDSYSAWELSGDRAYATRRLLSEFGVSESKFFSVTGRGSSSPLPYMHPTSDANDRVTISLDLSVPLNVSNLLNEGNEGEGL